MQILSKVTVSLDSGIKEFVKDNGEKYEYRKLKVIFPDYSYMELSIPKQFHSLPLFKSGDVITIKADILNVRLLSFEENPK